MANWQDIKALEERIYEAVEEFLNNQEAYAMPVLNVYLDQDDMTYKAAAEDGLQGTEDDGIYPMLELVRMGDDGKQEPDIDKISDVANSWIFLDWVSVKNYQKLKKINKKFVRTEREKETEIH